MPLNPMAGKGPLRHSNKVRTAHDSVASNDVDNFDRGGYPGDPHAATAGVDPVKVIAEFANLGEALRRSGTFREVAEQIARISEMAEQTIMQEAGDWFDGQTIKRNMKEMKNYSKDFSKIAEEMDNMQQRATALYDDMGNVLARYFEMTANGGEAPEEAPMGNDAQGEFGGKQAPAFDGPGGNPHDDTGRQKWDMRDGEEDDIEEERSPADQGIAAAKLDDAARKLGIPARQRGEEYDDYVGRVRAAAKGVKESAVAPDSYNARRSLKLPVTQQRVQGGFTRGQAKDILKKGKATTVTEAKKCLYQEIMRLAEAGEIKFPKDGKMLREKDPTLKEAALRKIVKSKTPRKINEHKVDVFTAGAIVAVLDGLRKPENKRAFLNMPISDMAQAAFKLVK